MNKASRKGHESNKVDIAVYKCLFFEMLYFFPIRDRQLLPQKKQPKGKQSSSGWNSMWPHVLSHLPSSPPEL